MWESSESLNHYNKYGICLNSMLVYFRIHSFTESLSKSLRSYFFINDKKRKEKMPFHFLSCFSFSCSLLFFVKVKVWFQNRRMKWKRVKGGQQGAAAREKELVNVKKGTLLPSELSGIGAATLQQTGDSLANEDSHDSDHSSEHAHLWYTERISSILRKEMSRWQALLKPSFTQREDYDSDF